MQPFEAISTPEHVVEYDHVVASQRKVLTGHLTHQRIEFLDLGFRPLLPNVVREEIPQVLVVVDD